MDHLETHEPDGFYGVLFDLAARVALGEKRPLVQFDGVSGMKELDNNGRTLVFAPGHIVHDTGRSRFGSSLRGLTRRGEMPAPWVSCGPNDVVDQKRGFDEHGNRQGTCPHGQPCRPTTVSRRCAQGRCPGTAPRQEGFMSDGRQRRRADARARCRGRARPATWKLSDIDSSPVLPTLGSSAATDFPLRNTSPPPRLSFRTVEYSFRCEKLRGVGVTVIVCALW